MSERSTRRRSKSAKALEAEEHVELTRSQRTVKSRGTKSSQKGRALGDFSESPSTPARSRSSSRAASPASSSRSGKRSRSSKKTSSAISRRGSKRGSKTPSGRASRSSSVASNSIKKVPKLKLKTKLGRGYNPSLVNYKESEYHYGSDFEDEEDEYLYDETSNKSSDESDDSTFGGDESDDMKVESDVDFDEIVASNSSSQTPVPYWLREDEQIPELELPKSSEDLLVPNQHILKVFSVYEILRKFSQILRLTPFCIEDFCAALTSEEQSTLLSEVHMALLKTLIRSEENSGTTFAPIDQKDSVNCVLFFMDSVTWPETLKAFLQSDASYQQTLEIVNSCDYPFDETSDSMLEKRVEVLSFLTDQVLLIQSVRDFIVDDGLQSNEENCRVCHRLGEMLVCETCPAVFHLGCLDPPLEEVPDEDWRCFLCRANEVEGVSDCNDERSNSCRQDTLGIDRMGNKYWFMCRRLVVEKQDGSVSYYTTVKQLEELSEVLDDELYEKELWQSMEEIRIEMERQMNVTEEITMSKKPASKKSYLEIENAAIEKIQREREEKSQQNEIDSSSQSSTLMENNAAINEVSDTKEQTTVDVTKKIAANPADAEAALSTLKDLRVTRRTLQEINTGTLFFKLGQEGSFKSYVNQYTAQPLSYSKQQANEERLKRQHMSHKFSLTDVAAFKWLGSLHGSKDLLRNSLRHTLLQLEGNISTIFMHPNWYLLRKPWITAVGNSSSSREFSRALTVLQCCVKPCVMLPVWHESLGHTMLKKFTSQMKEERKKLEKRERREREEEDERLRPFMTFVKYTLGLKHQVSKQKGEEYRAHGQTGWLWLSSVRPFIPKDARQMGLRQGPHRLAVKYFDVRSDTEKVVLMEPKAFSNLYEKQKEIDEEKLKQNNTNKSSESKEATNQSSGVHSTDSNEEGQSEKQAQERKRLEEALKNARLDYQEIPQHLLEEVVDVSAGLSNPTRVLYPKVAKKAKILDEFLSRRLQLKSLEEKRISLQGEKKAEPAKSETDKDVKENIEEQESKTVITSSLANDKSLSNSAPAQSNVSESAKQAIEAFLNQGKKKIWTMISKLKAAQLSSQEADEILKDQVPSANGDTNDLGKENVESESKTKVESVSEENQTKVNALLIEAVNMFQDLTKEAREIGLDVSKVEEDIKFENVEEAVLTLQDFVKQLMTKKEEHDKMDEIGMTTVTNTLGSTSKTELATNEVKDEKIVNGSSENGSQVSIPPQQMKTESKTLDDIKVESKPDISSESDKSSKIKRVYSNTDTSGNLYLKRIQTIAWAKKQGKVVKYPLAPDFFAKTRKEFSILRLAKDNLRKMARKFGVAYAEGFNYNAKQNNSVWPYPCPRPTFRTAWLFRTSSAKSLQAIALQLRIFWASIRWDDMATRPISIDGKHQETTEKATITTEIIAHKNIGRFSERTQYLQKKTTIPFDTQRNSAEATPIRSGLRKRRRAESPQQAEPKLEEEWIDEEKFELWEIRAYRERLEREKNASMTRLRTGTTIREPQRLDPSSDMNRTPQTPMAQGFKMKSKELDGLNSGTPTISKGPTIIRRVTNPDGTISLIHSTPQGVVSPNVSSVQNLLNQGQKAAKAVYISKDGKVISTPLASDNANKLGLTPVASSSPTVSAYSPQQKVQIVRSSDGNIQVRGLLPNQQLMQLSDGKFQIVTKGVSSNAPQVPQTMSAENSPQMLTVVGKTSVAENQQIQSTGSIQANLPSKPINAVQLAPGSAKPMGMTVFVSGGKTYCIPKASTSFAGGNLASQQQRIVSSNNTSSPLAQNSPVLLTTSSSISPAIKTTPSVTSSPLAAPKQVMEVKPLGNNTISFKDQQMIVSGPDIKEAQHIASLLSSGQMKLATIGGKQMLVSSSTINLQQRQVGNVVLPNQPLPATSAMGQTPERSIPQQTTTNISSQMKTSLSNNVAPTHVTAQIIQTNQGPRIVLQGIHGSNLPKEDLLKIQKTVKDELLKAQANAKLQGTVPPTKIQIQLPPEIQEKLYVTNAQQTTDPQQPSISHQKKTVVSGIASSKGVIGPVNGPRVVGIANPGGSEPFPQLHTKQQNESSTTNVTSGQLVQQSALEDKEVNSVDVPADKKDISQPLSSVNTSPIQSFKSTPIVKKTEVIEKPNVVNPPSVSNQEICSSKSDEVPMKIQVSNKLLTSLQRQKDQLKKTIAKKRATQERELNGAIIVDLEQKKRTRSKQLEAASIQREAKQMPSPPKASEMNNSHPSVTPEPTQAMPNAKRKRSDDSENDSLVIDSDHGAKKRKRNSSNNPLSQSSGTLKKDKLYCICKTKYDPSKFYVGCDICNDWFHGSCVGITEAMSRSLTEYVCMECQRAKENQEIYCLCKQPYNESQFYIGCEKCSDWFHGHCVGILQSEAEENIDEYLCPNCEPNSPINIANRKNLSEEELDLLKKLFKQIMVNRNSWPFKKPVDESDVPEYYSVVKEPMDLQKIDNKLNKSSYKTLAEFIGDIIRILENCRIFNLPNSQIARCADSLETFFAQKLVLVREKILENRK